MQNTDPKPVKEGWMVKCGGRIKTWRKRWFVLTGEILTYYKKPGGRWKGEIRITDARTVCDAPQCRKQPALQIEIPFVRTYYCITKTEDERREWIAALEKARVRAPAPATKVSLDDFDILRVIGRGTSGKVQLVRHKNDRQLYAMKSMSKKILADNGQIEQTLIEKNVLVKTQHPFLVGARFTFQSETKIFLILDYVAGGELFSRLKEEGKFSEKRVKLYAAEVLLGLEQLHKLGIIYRDLKPENVLVDVEGHLKITDFGLVKTDMTETSTTTTFCGTAEYISPEMIKKIPYTQVIDWWCFGILVFEMLTGIPPFYDDNTNSLYNSILNDPIDFPHYISNEAKDFISLLLDRNPKTRLGANGDADEIKRHPFFADINFDDVLNKKIKPEYVPNVKFDTDTSNFEQEFTRERAMISLEDETLIQKETQSAFENFTFVIDQ